MNYTEAERNPQPQTKFDKKVVAIGESLRALQSSNDPALSRVALERVQAHIAWMQRYAQAWEQLITGGWA